MVIRFVSHVISYVSSGFIISLALITVFYELSEERMIHKQTKIYPYFSDIKHDIQKIDIHFPETKITLQSTPKGWVVVSSDNFPADETIISRLFYDIENMVLVSKKTQNHDHFKHLDLLNPSEKQTLKGEGIRFTFYGKGKSQYAGFIIGEKLKSYKNPTNIRLFTRYGTTGGAYLAQATSDFQYNPLDFLSKNFGMPSIDEIVSAHLIIKSQDAFKIYRINDTNAKDTILFSPKEIPLGKKLLYPMIMNDYMIAFTKQLRPINVINLHLQKSMTDNEMILELTKGRIARVIFWKVNNDYYMRIIRTDIDKSYDAYIYQIASNDFDALMQPLDKFLTPDLPAKIIQKP